MREPATGPEAGELMEFVDEHSPDAALVIDCGGDILHASTSVERIGGFRVGDLVGRSVLGLVHPDDLDYTLGSLFEAGENPGDHGAIELRILTARGDWLSCEVETYNPPDDPAGRMVVALRDITARASLPERRRALERLVLRIGESCAGASLDGLESVLDEFTQMIGELLDADEVTLASISPDQSEVGQWRWGRTRRHVLAPTFSPDDVLSQAADVPHPGRLEVSLNPIPHAAVIQPVWSDDATLGILRICWHVPDARRHWDEGNGSLLNAAARILVMTAQRVQREEILSHQATHDALTGLGNRTRLLTALDHEINRTSGRCDADLMVAFCDLDRFKLINDHHGHHAGDEVLVAVAERLQASVRHGDLVCRVGGDEFVVLCPSVDDDVEAMAIASRMTDELAAPIQLSGGATVGISASIGAALVTGRSDHSMPAHELVRQADEAMYTAKAFGEGEVRLVRISLSAPVGAAAGH